MRCVCANTEIVRLLLEKGADVQRVTNTLDTPLHASVAGNRPDITDMLIKAGINITYIYPYHIVTMKSGLEVTQGHSFESLCHAPDCQEVT